MAALFALEVGADAALGRVHVAEPQQKLAVERHREYLVSLRRNSFRETAVAGEVDAEARLSLSLSLFSVRKRDV